MPDTHAPPAAPAPGATFAEDLAALSRCSGRTQQAEVLRRLLTSPFDAAQWSATHAETKRERHRLPLRRYIQHGTVKAFYDAKYTARTDGSELTVRLPKDKTDKAPVNTYHFPAPPLVPRSARNLNHNASPLFEVVQADPFDIASEIFGQGIVNPSSIAAINAADPAHPGGGYKSGSATLEAHFHRRSNIFNCLDDPQQLFSHKRKWSYPLNPEACLFSKDVCVIRGAEACGYPFLAKPFEVNVVSACLVDLGPPEKRRAMEHGTAATQLTAQRRLRAAFSVCAYFHCKWMILPVMPGMARLIRDVLLEDVFKHVFYRVSFATLAPLAADDATLAEYTQVFAQDAIALSDLRVVGRNKRRREDAPAATADHAAKRPKAIDVDKPPAAPPADATPIDVDMQYAIEDGLDHHPQRPQRLNIRQRFLKALQEPEEGGQVPVTRAGTLHRRAADIESAMHEHFGGNISTMGYRSQLKALLSNLADKRNAALRARIVSGAVTATALPKMTPQQLCNPEKQAEETNIRSEITADIMAGGNTAQETSMHTCGRCRKRRCAYYEMQIRSGDEPTTQFIKCLNCGNTWRIG